MWAFLLRQTQFIHNQEQLQVAIANFENVARIVGFLRSNSLFFLSVNDFSDEPITVVVPANQQKIEIQKFFTIVDDNIDEDRQSFAVVAEIGPDVPENVSCFQLGIRETVCHGRQGAIEIIIIDNNRKYSSLFLLILR